MQPLTRQEFRNQVFDRDSHRCVVCGEPAQDPHHIIERRLWGVSQGYFLDNGASVCAEHHWQCETTEISVEAIREFAGITNVILPDHLSSEHAYDKWGNRVLETGLRQKGELFYEDGVQKVLRKGRMLHLFVN